MRVAWKYKAEARAEQQQSGDGGGSTVSHAVLAAVQAGKLGVCFSGTAFGAAYQLGAAQILQDLSLLDPDTPVAGASAGAIVAVGTCCRLGQLGVLGALTAIADDLLQHGEKGRLQGVLQQQMQQILPPDAYQLCSSNVTHSQAHYHITQPPDQAGLHTGGGYSSTCTPAHLLDALLTGAHIPRTSSGSLLTHYRGHLYMDSGRHTSMRMGEGRYPYQDLFSLMHDAGAAPRGAPPMSWDKCVTRDLQAFG